MPLKGQIWSARRSASCTTSSARSSRLGPTSRAMAETICPAAWRNRWSTSPSRRGAAFATGRGSHLVDLTDLQRIELQMRVIARQLDHLLVARRIDEPVAADDLLRFRERTVGHRELAAGLAEHAAFVVTELVGIDQPAGTGDTLGPAFVFEHRALDLFRAHLRAEARATRQQQEFGHVVSPCLKAGPFLRVDVPRPRRSVRRKDEWPAGNSTSSQTTRRLTAIATAAP